jgi:hypothetical protein
MVKKYAYLKPKPGDSPYYVHVTLDDQQKIVTVYYHRSWWKGETVDPQLFEQWREQLLHIKGLLKKPKIKTGPHALRIKGKGVVQSQMLKDIFGFVERDTHDCINSKIDGYVHSKEKVIEMTVNLPYKSLGAFPSEISKLPIFSLDPDAESVRTNLVFFNQSYVTDAVKPSGKTLKTSESRHDGGPAQTGSSFETEGGAGGDPGADSKEEKEARFQKDPRFSAGEHPYGAGVANPQPDPIPDPDQEEASADPEKQGQGDESRAPGGNEDGDGDETCTSTQ